MGKPRSCRINAWSVVLLTAAAGCGGLKLHPVSGRVTLDDKPVAGAAVMFQPAEGGPVAHAVTDAEGRYTLETTNRAGAPAGLHLVTVTKQRTLGVREDETVEPGGLRVEWLVPERYSKAATSGLKVTVPAEAFDLRLTAK